MYKLVFLNREEKGKVSIFSFFRSVAEKSEKLAHLKKFKITIFLGGDRKIVLHCWRRKINEIYKYVFHLYLIF